MATYKHWLILDKKDIDMMSATELVKELVAYQKEHKATIEIYHRDSGSYEHIFSVETDQTYNDLDLTCNSGSNSFKRVEHKPKNIHKGRVFEEYIQRYNLK